MTTKLLEAALDLRSLIDTNARESGDTHVPRATVDACVEAGLHGANVPREVGGSELGLVDTIDVWSAVSYADGSAGWSLMASATTSCFFGSYGGDVLIDAMFSDGVPLAAGQFAPNGVAVRDGDGWIVNGEYQFGSGIDVAEWVGGGTLTQPPDGSDEQSEILFTMFPASCVERKGNWDVLGLRATSSEDYIVRDVRVHDDATFKFFDPTRRRGGPVYELGVLGLTAVGHTGFMLGVVRRAVDELIDIAQTKHRLGAMTALRDSERFLHDLGILEARVRANEALVRSEFSKGQAAVEASGAPDPRVANALRATTVHITQEGADIVRQAYLLAGTSGLRRGPLERCFRDVHAATQHYFASPAGPIDFGRDLLAPKSE